MPEGGTTMRDKDDRYEMEDMAGEDPDLTQNKETQGGSAVQAGRQLTYYSITQITAYLKDNKKNIFSKPFWSTVTSHTTFTHCCFFNFNLIVNLNFHLIFVFCPLCS